MMVLMNKSILDANFQRKVNYIIINTLQKNYHAFLLQERRKTITFFNDFW